MILASQYQDGLIKLPVYDASSLTKGTPLAWGADAGTYNGTVYNTLVAITGADPADVFAVIAETPTTVTTTNRNTPVINQALCQIVENHKIFRVYYDMATGTDLDVTSSTSSIVTHGTSDQDGDGGWIYINSGTGAGQLRYIKTADATTKTVNTAFTTTPASDSDFVWIRCEGIHTGGHDLGATPNVLDSVLLAGGRELLVLKNFVHGAAGPAELDITRNPHLECDGLNTRGVRFYSLVMFLDTTFSATGRT